MTSGYSIPHSKPTLGVEEEKALTEVLRSGHIAQGAQVEKFEQKLAQHVGMSGGVAVNSGTSALHLALLALGIQKSDQVIIPSFTCCALLHAINYVGAEPVLVDIDPDSYNLDTQATKRSITKRTKAIIVPHMFGLPADLDELISLGIPIIEDCAQSIGASYKGKQVGSFGVISVFSFYATKVITTGEGGMVTTNSVELLEKIRDLRDYDQKANYKVRYNYKMTDLQAALGRVQLEKLPNIVAKRQRIARQYLSELKTLNIKLPRLYKGKEHIFYRFVIEPKESNAIEMNALKELGIHCAKPVYKPLHHYLGIKGFAKTESAWEKVLSLPIYPSLDPKDISYVVAGIRSRYGC